MNSLRIDNITNRTYPSRVAKTKTKHIKTSYPLEKENNNSKVTAKEGCKLLLTGAKDKVKDIVLSLIKHPIATITSVALTSCLISAAPLIGISSGALAGAIGVGFMGISVFELAKNTTKALMDVKKNDNSSLREDLKNIGSSAVDTILSSRQLKNNLTNVKYQLKYGKVAPRKEFFLKLKNEKTFKKKVALFGEFDRKVSADINCIAGIDELQKELKFSNDIRKKYFDLYKIDDKKEFITRAYKRLTEDLGYKNGNSDLAPSLVFDYGKSIAEASYIRDENQVRFYMKKYLKKDFSNELKVSHLSTLRHELQHFQQLIDLERAEGLSLLNFTNMQRGDKSKIIALAKKQGAIKKGSRGYSKAKSYYKNMFNYSRAPQSKAGSDLKSKLTYYSKIIKYLFNPIERDAYHKEAVFTPMLDCALASCIINWRALIPVNLINGLNKEKVAINQ